MELTDYIQYVVALAFVLALIGILFWALKKFRSSSIATGSGGRRLDVVEGAVVDSKRRLVLVRRDNVEHLLLIGPMQDLVIETGIGAASRPSPSRKPASAPQAARPAKTAPTSQSSSESGKKTGALNWKLSGKEHVDPPASKKKPAAKTQAKTSDIRPGDQK